MSDILDSVQQFYDEAGEYFSKTRRKSYDEKGNHNWKELEPYLGMLKDGDSVLDLGCGNGRLLTGIKTKTKYLGIDFSKTLIEEAKKYHQGSRFLVRDISKSSTWIGLPKYNAIFCIATLHHLPMRKQHLYVIKQIKKHLKDDGFAVVTVWNLLQDRYHLQHLKDLPLKIKNPRWLMVPFAGKWKRFCFTFDKYYLGKLASDAGLNVQELYYAGKDGRKVGPLRGRNLVAVLRK